jgi:hypothetical protein
MWDVLGTIVGSALSVGYFFAAGVVIHAAREDPAKLSSIAMGFALALYLAVAAGLLWWI